jgi:peptide/nickel transport system substrate-binding protein
VKYQPASAKIQPDLAESWEIKDGGRTIIFHLRKNVKWHKGYGELTAEDVKFTFDRNMDDATASPYQGFFIPVKEVTVVDQYTIKVSFKTPYPIFLSAVLPWRPGIIYSKKAFQEMGQAKFSKNPIGTGPYEFVKMTAEKKVILQRNENYYGKLPQIKKITLVPIRDETVAVMALEKRDVDFIWTRAMPEVYAQLRKNPDIVVGVSETTGSQRMLILNMTVKPLDDVRVRKAIAHAIDRNALVAVLGDKHKPAYSTLHPQYEAYTTDVVKYEFDRKKAKGLLKEAGYPDGFATELLYSTRQPDPTMAEIIVEQLSKVGIKATPVPMEHATWMKVVGEAKHAITMQGPARPPDPDLIYEEFFHSRSFPPKKNFSHYKGVDDLLDAAKTEPNESKRLALYKKVQQRIAEEVPVIPMTYEHYAYAHWKEYKNFKMGLLNEFWFEYLRVEK